VSASKRNQETASCSHFKVVRLVVESHPNTRNTVKVIKVFPNVFADMIGKHKLRH